MNQEAQFANDGNKQEIRFLDCIYTIASNWRLLTIGPLLTGLVALGIAFLIRPTFTASTKFLPPQQQSSAATMLQSLGSIGGLAGVATGLKNPADQYIAFLKSRSVQDSLVDRFKLVNRYEAQLKEDAIAALAANTRITSGKDGLIGLEFDDYEPAFAAQVANGYIEELGKLLGRLAITEAQQRRVFFEKQLLQTKAKLTEAELALQASGIPESALKTNPSTAIVSVAQMQAQITALEVKLSSMRGYMTESAPEFKQSLAELRALRSESEKAAQATEKISVDGANYVAKFRNVKYYETLFELFAKQFELAKVDEAREGSVIQVVDAAVPPQRKSKPKKALVAIAATLVSAFFLLIFVFVRQSIRNQSKDPISAQKMESIRNAWK